MAKSRASKALALKKYLMTRCLGLIFNYKIIKKLFNLQQYYITVLLCPRLPSTLFVGIRNGELEGKECHDAASNQSGGTCLEGGVASTDFFTFLFFLVFF